MKTSSSPGCGLLPGEVRVGEKRRNRLLELGGVLARDMQRVAERGDVRDTGKPMERLGERRSLAAAPCTDQVDRLTACSTSWGVPVARRRPYAM